MQKARNRPPKRIFYPKGSWFPLPNEVFEDVLPHLRNKRSRQLYIALYERVQRHPSKPIFTANLNDLAKIIDCDARTARGCIVELGRKGFVEIVDKGGKLRSRTKKPKLMVPLANKSLESGSWFPVPRFFVTHYLPKYPGTLVLIALLWHQHMKWKSYSWPGVNRLVEVLGMTRRSVYAYLHGMGHEAQWKRLETGLPWPLEISYSPNRQRRRFSVRAAQFYTPAGRKKPVVRLREGFAIHFGYARRKPISTDSKTVHSGR